MQNSRNYFTFATLLLKIDILPHKALLTIIPILFLTAYIYTAVRLCKIMPATLLPRGNLLVLFILGIAATILFFVLREKLTVPIASALYRFGTSWLIIFLYLLLAVLLIDIFRLVNGAFHFISKEAVIEIFSNNGITSAIIFGAVGVILIFGNIQYHNKKRQHITIASEKIDKPIRIVGISDLHTGYTISAREVAKWVKMINSEGPDMVIIAGDIIDNHLRPLLRDSTEEVFRQIRAPMGVFACTGNHDHMFAINEDPGFYTRSGIKLLRDSSVTINGITVIGRDDYSNKQRAGLHSIMRQVDTSTFTLLLDHQPVKLDEAVKNEIDFQFSGHTHRGQVFPISLVTDKLFKLSHGYYKKVDTHFYVSSGLGIWGGKFRVGTRSEYLVLDLAPHGQTK